MKPFLFCICLVLTASLYAQTPPKLTISISNISPPAGDLFIAIYDNEDDYMNIKKAAFKKIAPVTGEVQSVFIDDLQEGNYAIAVFQDLNGNGELDTKGMGVPKEPFGFSNDVRGKFGPPKFKDAQFPYPKIKDIRINLVNNAPE